MKKIFYLLLTGISINAFSQVTGIPDGKFFQIGDYSNSNEPKGILFTGYRDITPNFFGASIEAVNTWTCCNGYPNGGYPGIKFLGLDFNFHVFNDADNASNKFTAMSITADGRVGINNRNPRSKLDVVTNGQGVLIDYQDRPAVSFIPNNGNSWFHISHGLNDDLAISQGGNVDDGRLVTIKNSGYVGIGKKNPQARLDVLGGIIVGDNDNSFSYNGADITLKASSRGSGGRAIVHESNNTLTLNYIGEFT